MKKFFVAMLMAAAVLMTSVSFAAVDYPVLLNEGFEGAYGYTASNLPLDASGKTSVGAYAGGSFGVSDEKVYSGEKALKIACGSWWGVFFRAYGLVGTNPNGKKYSISFKVAGNPANTGSEALKVKLQYDAKSVDLGTVTPANKDWQTFSVEYAFSATALAADDKIWEKCEIFIEQQGTGNTYYFDDAVVKEINPNIALDLGFEGATPLAKTAADKVTLAATDYAFDGESALEISAQANVNGSVYFKPGGSSILSKEKDTTANVYELSFDCAASADNTADTTVEWYYSYTNDAGTWRYVKPGAFVVPAGQPYKSYRMRFQTNENNWMWSPEVYNIIKSTGDAKIYIDNFKLQKIALETAAGADIEAEGVFAIDENGTYTETDLANLETGKTYVYSLQNVTSSSKTAYSMTPIIALYDGGKLVDMDFGTIEAVATSVASLAPSVTVPETAGNYSIKTFMWDTMASLKPLAR